MPLPTIATPEYSLTLPITGAKIKFRPFLAKEQKILLLAAEGKDKSQILDTIGQLVESCCKDLPCNYKKLPLIDIEAIFLNLRMKSVGESVKVTVKCPHCQAANEIDVDLSQFAIEKPATHTNAIKLTDTIGVIMKYPSIETMSDALLDGKELTNDSVVVQPSKLLEIVQESIEAVFTDTGKFPFSEATPEEIENFVGSLSLQNLEKLTSFYSTMPGFRKTFNLTCTKCKATFDLAIENIYDFFT